MGRDKAFIRIDGLPLWQRQLQTLRELAPDELFISGPERPEWVEAGVEIVTDTIPERGPLGGIVAALRRAQHGRLLVLAIDLSRMSANYLGGLLAQSTSHCGAVPRHNDGLFEPLAAIYPRAILSLAEDFLHAPRYSLQSLLAESIARGYITETKITPTEQPFFLNANRPGDVAL
jgi:molybdenum cofactor guanylyltransferase